MKKYFKILLICLAIIMSFSYILVNDNVNIEAKATKVYKNKQGKIIKKVKYYEDGKTKQILQYKYFKNGTKKQIISKYYYTNKKMKSYAKYYYVKDNNKRKLKSKRIVKYNLKGKRNYEKYYRYNVYSEQFNCQVNVYRVKKYNNGILNSDSILYVEYKTKLKSEKIIDEYKVINGKNNKYRKMYYNYYDNKRNKVSYKRMYFVSNTSLKYEYDYNTNGELKSNKYGNAYKYILNYEDWTIITYKYDSKGIAVYESGPKPIPIYPD